MNMDNTNITFIVLTVALAFVAAAYVRERIKAHRKQVEMEYNEFRKDIWREVDSLYERLDKVDHRIDAFDSGCCKMPCGQQYPVV